MPIYLMLSVWFSTEMGEIGVSDRFINVFKDELCAPF
jgi:hypothetical protein